MSITVSNCNQICNSPTNGSKSKMLYTFAKQARFVRKLPVLCDKFYSPLRGHGRTTSLGYGNKYDFTKDKTNSPPPNRYGIKSEFGNSKRGTVFGKGREEIKVTGPFMPSMQNVNPGPGAYQSKLTLSKVSYSMRGKNFKNDRERALVPGPGSYSNGCELNSSGKYPITKHKNNCTFKFSSATRKRVTLHEFSPGPGQYDGSKAEMSPQGKYPLSNMRNSLARRFGSSVRQPLVARNSTPGPGNYLLPSQFGQYLSKFTVSQKQNIRQIDTNLRYTDIPQQTDRPLNLQ